MKLTRRIASAFRVLTRGYDAASGSPRWPAWASQYAQGREALAARHPLAHRAGYLVANSPTAESIVEKWQTNLIGDGPSVRSRHPNEGVRAALEDAWAEFYAHADLEGVSDLTGILNTLVRSLVTAGEAFPRLVTVERGEPRVQLLSPEQIDPSINRDLGNGGHIVAGIEMDAAGRRVGYHALREAPDSAWSTMVGPPVRIPASDLCHVYERRFPGQVRGLSWFAPVATRLVELSKLEDALLARMNTAALFSGFITGEGSGGFDEKSQINPMEPGALMDLRGLGTTGVTFSDVPDTNGAPDLLKHMLHSIASGVALPYPIMASDYADVNYSSGTLGREQHFRRVKALQSSLIVGQFLQPLWNRFVTLETLSGRLHAPDFAQNAAPYFAVSFLFPAWSSLNPLDEARAEALAINSGIRSRQEVIASRGRDPAEVDAELSTDTFIARPQSGSLLQEPQNAAA